MKRACGVLLPISSLPSPFGIGAFSKEAFDFVDQLEAAGQSYWQILPLSPTGYGDSPYQSRSAFAGNLNYIDLEELIHQGLLEEKEVTEIAWGEEGQVDYGIIWEQRESVLQKAFQRFLKGERLEHSREGAEGEGTEKEKEPGILELEDFERERKALPEDTRNFCLYQAIKKSQKYAPWYQWDTPLKMRETKALEEVEETCREQILFYQWTQVVFTRQWQKLKDYANGKGIQIIGDLPIYVSLDSADSWSHPELFVFDQNRAPLLVAGCPPDYFSADGQLWGNPVYDWEYHKKTDYAWWMERLAHTFSLYDYVRLDHFRGFDEYYAIPAGASNAREGEWKKGPNMEIFTKAAACFKDRFDTLPIIAEDMGILTDSVIALVEKSGFPSMKVLEFAFDSDNKNFYLPHNYPRNCVAYTGTHDNTTLAAWIKGQSPHVRSFMQRYMGGIYTPEEELYWDCIRMLLRSVADTVIIPMQDYLGLPEYARLNSPGVGEGNWRFRLKPGEVTTALLEKMGELAYLYARKGQ